MAVLVLFGSSLFLPGKSHAENNSVVPERIDPFTLTADLSHSMAAALGKKLITIRPDDARSSNNFDTATMRHLMKEGSQKAQE